MADIHPSETSFVAPLVAAPIRDSIEEGGGGGGGSLGKAKEGASEVESATPPENAPRVDHAAPEVGAPNTEGDAARGSDLPSIAGHSPTIICDAAIATSTTQLRTPPLTAHPSPDPGQTSTTTAQAQPLHSQPPLKRFTSVNINKRFLEKTSSSSGPSLTGSPLAGHSSGGASAGGSGQRRGVSPASRSPSTDRPAPSRLVTTKLTAVPQPASAATSGWLRPTSSTPGNSATPTPTSGSPQPTVNGPSTSFPPPSSSSGAQSIKRRPGDASTQNGTLSSGATSASQQSGSKSVWGKVPPPPNSGLGRGKEIQNDFPTAAEAAHGRKTKVLNAQLAAETAAAQTAAQKQAMIETAAAFRGMHLDPNAHHWDEMEDEDSDFLAGVIEFGDGTQYKIENKPETAVGHDAQPAAALLSDSQNPASAQPLTRGLPQTHPLVTKEERFGEDFDRSWPRGRGSSLHSTSSTSLPRVTAPQQAGSHPPPTETSHPSQDGTASTSRVLFNERSNRLEPWSNARPRLGPGQAPSPMTRRDSREDHPPFASRPQQNSQPQGREAPPHSHPSSANVQLLQKDPPGPESAWKNGPQRGFGHGVERGRWADGPGPRGALPPRDEERPWDARRRESMSSSDAPSPFGRDPSRDREGGRNRWDTGATPQGRDLDHDRERGRRLSNIGPPPVLPPSLARERSRDAGRQLPPHLSRMPPPSVPPIRGAPGRDQPSHARAPTLSPSASVRSLLSPSSEQAPSISSAPGAAVGVEESVDKNALVKDAMHLAIERAKRRKQEGEAEEQRRLEAAERAKKKAEALAVAQEKKKGEALPPVQEEKKSSQERPQLLLKPNGVEPNKQRDSVRPGPKHAPQAESVPPKPVFGRAPEPLLRTVVPAPNLPRRPVVPPPTQSTPASHADSWRSKAAPVPPSPPRPSSLPHLPQPATPAPPLPPPPAPRGALPSTTEIPEWDLSVNPDESIEIVDFSDLGKFMGHPSPPAPAPAPQEHGPVSSIRTGRPVSDCFDDRPASSKEPLAPLKSDVPSWRRPAPKPAAMPLAASPGEELGTQTMPIFTADDALPVKDTTISPSESKPLSSPTMSPKFKRQSSQCDQTSSSTTQSVYVPPAVLALRSPPRASSQFKEAPMSALTDTMSRIKGAIAGMQSQDPFTTHQAKEAKEASPEQSVPPTSTSAKAKPIEPSAMLWREHRELRSEASPQVTKIVAVPPIRVTLREVFDITRPDPQRSPKPAWNAFIVRLPKESRAHDAVSRKQLHFWNLPHSGVRWDILSWEPPVEGMNKRELSRDEIFHRKNAIKGGKLRVLLPNKRVIHSSLLGLEPPRESSNAVSRSALITAAGVKIKLPSAASVSSQTSIQRLRAVSSERPRDSGVPLWRKSAMSVTPAKKDRQITAPVNGSPPDRELNTISRSPPPEPSTPLPQFVNPQSGVASPAPSAQSATVSLPTNSPSDSKESASKRPSRTDVAFYRTSRGEPEADVGKPLPRFTVTSELDSGGPAAAPVNQTTDSESGQSNIQSLKGSPRNDSPAGTPLPSLVTNSKSESKSADESTTVARSLSPPSTHTSSAWGKSPLNFSLKESPARSAPDPEHLKAVWSQAPGRSAGTTSNSLKGIADDLPSIPFTVQDMKSEDGETPPPTAPVPPPSRLSLQEVTRAFQQVPSASASVNSPASRPPSYAQTPLLSGNAQAHRSNQPVAISLPPQHAVRPAFAPYPHSIVGHSPSPTMMYAPGIPSPIAHHRMSVNGPSPPVAHAMWLPTPPPPPPQSGSFMRTGGAPPSAPMMYPSPVPGPSAGAPGQMMHRRMSVVSPGGVPPPSGPSMYPGHPMDIQGHMHHTHAQSPHHVHAHPVGHAMPHMHVGHIFSPPQPGQAPTMYAVPVGAGRGGMMPRPGYEGMHQVPQLPPHNPGYQPVPPTSFVHPFHS